MSAENPDRFGFPRLGGYRQQDYELCPLLPKLTPTQPCSGACPQCGGYGEIPIAGEPEVTA